MSERIKTQIKGVVTQIKGVVASVEDGVATIWLNVPLDDARDDVDWQKFYSESEDGENARPNHAEIDIDVLPAHRQYIQEGNRVLITVELVDDPPVVTTRQLSFE